MPAPTCANCRDRGWIMRWPDPAQPDYCVRYACPIPGCAAREAVDYGRALHGQPALPEWTPPQGESV